MFLEAALTYQQYGLQAVPARADKRPIGAWAKLQKDFLSKEELEERFNSPPADHPIGGVGIVCGQVSGGLEVLDVDVKYDLTGKLYTNFKNLIDDNLPEVSASLVIGMTRSGGYHIYYRAADIAGSQKLARRPTNSEELAKEPNEKVKVLLETRGEGGFIVTAPTPGYSLIQGGFSSIPLLTPEQRTILLSIARSFNEEPEAEPVRPQEPRAKPTDGSVSPFADYNQRGDVVELLERHGWKIVGRQGQRIQLKRPGDSDTKTSGNFHEQLRKLYVFSSSTQFEPEKSYSPTDVFILLECNGDKSAASRQLRDMGYGTSEPIRPKKTKVRTEHVHVDTEDGNGDQSWRVDSEGELTEEAIREAAGETIYIYFTEATPRQEVIQSLDLIERTRPTMPLYALEVASLEQKHTSPIQTLRPYEFRAMDIFERYAEDYKANSDYVGPEREDAFINEFIHVGQTLKDPIDRDRFQALFLRFSEENQLGITKDTIAAKMDQLRYSQQREQQSQEISQLLDRAADLQKNGDLSKLLSELVSKGREIGSKAKSDTFKALTKPVLESDFAARINRKPTDLLTGLHVGEGEDREEIRLPAGAISIIAAPTSHGKTAMLLNMAIKVAMDLPKKKVYVLGYEEDSDSVLIRAINTYVGKVLSANNQRTITSYYRGHDYFKQHKVEFERLKNEFFADYISTGRLSIQYLDYDSDALAEAIHYLHKEGDAAAFFIDYIQLLRKADQRFSSRTEELKQICLDLKDVSVDTGLPVVLAAQFNRRVQNPLQMHPTNISEAGDIERIANVLLAMWNNNKKMLISDSDRDILNDKGYRLQPDTVYVEMLKNRGGKPDLTGMLSFNGNTGVIENERSLGSNGAFNKSTTPNFSNLI